MFSQKKCDAMNAYITVYLEVPFLTAQFPFQSEDIWIGSASSADKWGWLIYWLLLGQMLTSGPAYCYYNEVSISTFD